MNQIAAPAVLGPWHSESKQQGRSVERPCTLTGDGRSHFSGAPAAIQALRMLSTSGVRWAGAVPRRGSRPPPLRRSGGGAGRRVFPPPAPGGGGGGPPGF